MADKKPVPPKILVTKDYEMFGFSEKDNRSITPAQVQQVGREIDRKNLSEVSPIRVRPKNGDSKHIITDGQHTFLALKERLEWIFYIVSERFDFDDIPHFNSVRKNWSMEDYLKIFCQQGIQQYQVYSGFKKRSGWAHSTLIFMLTGNRKGAIVDFKSGNFKMTTSIADANMVIDMVNDFADHFQYYMSRNFVVALLKIFKLEEYDHKRMMTKLDYLSARLIKSVYVEDYLRILEDIYNYKAMGNKVRFF